MSSSSSRRGKKGEQIFMNDVDRRSGTSRRRENLLTLVLGSHVSRIIGTKE